MSETKLTPFDYYPLSGYISLTSPKVKYRAKWNGEFRAPKKGEWYLSGAIIEAYKASNDLTHPYHIATIHKVRQVSYWEEV